MSPRLLYLLSAEHAPACERDRIDAWTAVARMPGRGAAWEESSWLAADGCLDGRCAPPASPGIGVGGVGSV